MKPAHPTVLEKPSAAGTVAVLLIVMALAWLAARPMTLPAAAPVQARANTFSAARARVHLDLLAQTPRPIASAANARARDYIVEKLRAIGLAPEIQVATVQAGWHRAEETHLTLGVVNNIVVRKRGSAGAAGPALLMTAHYDSAPDALGAAAAGAPVAALLETLRALQSAPPLRNDLIVLFADGEDAGSLGMRGFVEQHRWAPDAGVVLTFDGAGTSGPLVLLDASAGNGEVIDVWAGAAPLATGSSQLRLAGLAQRLGATAALRPLAVPTMSFASLEDSAGAQDRIDARTVQHSGDTMLALARAFGNRPLAHIAAPDQVYFSMGALGVARYPARHVWYLTRLACLVFIVVAWGLVWRRAMTPRQLAWGALAYLGMMGSAAAAAWLLWRYYPGAHYTGGAGRHDHWYLLGAAALASALFIVMQRRLQAATGMAAAVMGALLVMVMLLVGASASMPGATYLLAWPLIGALLAFGALYVPRVGALPYAVRVAILVMGLAPAVVLIVPVVRQMFTVPDPGQINLPMTALALLLGMAVTLLAATHRRFVAPALLAASAACMTVANARVPYSAPVATANRMTYLTDARSWKAYWLLPDSRLDGYSRRFFPQEAKARAAPDVAGILDTAWVAEAPRTGIALPHVEMLSNVDDGKRRRVAFVLQSRNAAPTIEVRAGGPTLTHVTLNGKALAGPAAARWTLTLHGMGRQALDFQMHFDGSAIARVDVMEKIPGLPPGATDARPVRAHLPLSEQTLATDTLLFR